MMLVSCQRLRKVDSTCVTATYDKAETFDNLKKFNL